jgi:hypothetical protein
LRRHAFDIRRHEQQWIRAVQAQRIGAKIAGIAIEKPEARDIEREIAVFARQQHKVVRLEQQRVANVNRERAVCQKS